MGAHSSSVTVLAMGPSQLLAAAAAIRQERLSAQRTMVFYRGVSAPGIEEMLQRLSHSLGFSWGGTLAGNSTVVPRGGLTGRLDRLESLMASDRYLKRRIGTELQSLSKAAADTIVLALRHAQQDDPFLLAALKPSAVLYIVDGVIVGPPAQRRFASAERAALGRFGAPYPLNDPIFTPDYLEEHARKVGRVELLDGAILESVFEDARRAMDGADEFDHVILSQHLAMSRLTTELEEVRVWADICEFVASRHAGARILFKPHPRDRAMKVTLLRDRLGPGAQLVEPHSSRRAQPLEAMILPEEGWVYGLSSSALLYAARHARRNVAVLNSQKWPNELTGEISTFASETQLPMLWLDS